MPPRPLLRLVLLPAATMLLLLGCGVSSLTAGSAQDEAAVASARLAPAEAGSEGTASSGEAPVPAAFAVSADAAARVRTDRPIDPFPPAEAGAATAPVLTEAAAAATAAAEETSARLAIERVRPALVLIRVVWSSFEGGREVKQQAGGSGAIISKRGYVITNHHVAGRATRIICVLPSNEEIEAELVGTDPLSDIAVLRLLAPSQREFPFVEFGDSGKVRQGDEVLAMGSPLTLSQSVTRGIASNVKMVMPGTYRDYDRFELEGEPVGAMVRWLAHDAKILPGNSGGPLVDMQGRVIGINEISFGLAGAIPGNLARDVAAQLIEHGRVLRSWLGLELQPLLKDGSVDRGVLVRGVVEGSPAASAGLRSGDVVVSIDGHDTTVRFDEELPLLNQWLAALPVGKRVGVVISRAGAESEVKIKTVERRPREPRTVELDAWGLTARDLSPATARELGLDKAEGVLVTSVRPAGPAGRAKPPLGARDVIREVNGARVSRLEDLIALGDKLEAGRDRQVPVLVAVSRPPLELLTVVEVGAKKHEPPAREVDKAWLPAAVQVISRDLAAGLGDRSMGGVRVTQVYPGTSAARDGLKTGDLIVALDGEKLRLNETGGEESFRSLIRGYSIGASPELTVLRAGKRIDLAVELEANPPPAREMPQYEDERFEFTVRDLTFFDRNDEPWPREGGGVLVSEVKGGSWAELGGLQVGDLVESVDGDRLAGVAAFAARMKTIAAAKPRYVVLRILRGVHTHYLQLETVWREH